MIRTKFRRRYNISLVFATFSVCIALTCASCATTLNHGRVLDSYKSELTLRSPNAILGTQVDYQYGLTDKVTIGLSAKGMLFPGGEIYGIYGIESEMLDLTLQAGISADPYGYDKKGNGSSFGPWISWSSSVAASKQLGDFLPFFGLHGDNWKLLAELGSEWKWEHLRVSLSGIASYFYNDYGPVDYSNSGIVFSFKNRTMLLGLVPAISWEF